MSIKNFNDTIGNRTRDLPAFIAVPQPTAPPRAPDYTVILLIFYLLFLKFIVMFFVTHTKNSLCFTSQRQVIGPSKGSKFCSVSGSNRIFVNTLSWLILINGVSLQSQVSPCDTCGGQISTGTGFPPRTSVSPCRSHTTNVAYSSSSTSCSYQKDKGAKMGNVSNSNFLSEIGKQWIENNSTFFNTCFWNLPSPPHPHARVLMY